MCAECHSTNLNKNYNADNNTYQTTWSEIDVSCEACHGPGSNHVIWANSPDKISLKHVSAKGLVVDFGDAVSGEWRFNSDKAIASRTRPVNNNKLTETCARCHSRRTTIDSKDIHNKTLHDTHLVSTLDQGLYHPDGQIEAEVYVYGSFIQSKMYHAGVNCIDCHEAHSLGLLAVGNQLCLQCHKQSKYDAEMHHFHQMETEGAKCVACHMPAKYYMVIDTRHDHSFRIPRPDLSIKIGTPNACNQCHIDQSSEWSAGKIKQWYEKEESDFHYGEAIHAGRTGAINAEELLSGVALDKRLPTIARATAISQLRSYLTPQSLKIITDSIKSEDPMIRIASLNTLDVLNVAMRYQLASELLSVPVKSVRIHAARLLAGTPQSGLTVKQRKQLEHAIKEYITSQEENGDRAFAHANLESSIKYAEKLAELTPDDLQAQQLLRKLRTKLENE